MARCLALLLTATALVACTGSSDSPSGPTSCDPLAAGSTRLAKILGVGRDAVGTLYVADIGGAAGDASSVRVFVSAKGVLVRQDVIGSGQDGNSHFDETFQGAHGSPGPRDLKIVLQGASASSMTLAPEGAGKSMPGGGPGETSLTLVDASTVKGMPVRDLPGEVSYVADAASGDAIVVAEPMDAESTASFRLFYGTPSAMTQRKIVSFDQPGSGYPSIGFKVGSQTYLMAISSIPSSGGAPFPKPGPVSLTGGGSMVAMTLRLPTPSALDGFRFDCIGP